MILNNGDKYIGSFENDEQNGHGLYYYNDGDRYEGLTIYFYIEDYNMSICDCI